MKTIVRLCWVICLSMTLNSYGALLGSWNMDDLVDGVAYDDSGNLNDGYLANGATSTTGYSGTAVSLDGTDDYILVPHNSTLVSTTNKLTIDLWICPGGDTGNWQYIVAKWNNYYLRYSVVYQSLGFGVFDSNGKEKVVKVSCTLNTGTWYHVKATYDGVYARIYLDDQLQGTGFLNISLNTSDTNNLHIGSVSWGVAQTFMGAIDEVKIYDTAEGESEPGEYGVLYGKWSMNENSGTVAADSSGNGHDGTLENGAAWVAGYSGSGVSMDGTDDYILVPMESTPVSTTGQITVSAYVKFNAITTTCQTIAAQWGNYYLRVVNQTLSFGLFTPSQVETESKVDYPFVAGTWYHIVATYDGENVRIYINDKRVKEVSLNIEIYAKAVSATPNLHIGSTGWGVSETFNGVIDEVEISDTAYGQQGPASIGNLIGYWSMNESSGSVAHDGTTNDNDGALKNSATFATGYSGTALSLDYKTKDYVLVPNSSTLIPTANKLALDCWINITADTGAYQTVMARWYTCYLRVKTTYISFGIFDANKKEKITGTSYTFVPGTWYHLTASYDGTTSRIFVNGTLVTSNALGVTLYASSTKDLHIGSISWGISETFYGLIDEVRIYNRAVTVVPTTIAPVFSPAGPTLTGGSTVTISSTTTTAKIYYTTDGSDPTTGTEGDNPVTVNVASGTTLRAVAFGSDTSYETQQTYEFPKAEAPTFTPGGPYISGPTDVTISSDQSGASIYYTTDGSTPTTGGTAYASPVTVTVSDGMTLNAISIAENYSSSDVTSLTFEVPETYDDPETISYGSVTVDGDLADWSNATWAAIDQVYQDNPTDISEAYYAAKWQANKIYLAVKVLDTAPYFTDTYTAWDARDAIEIYLHTDNNEAINYPNCAAAQEYIVGIKSNKTAVWSALGNNSMYPNNMLTWSDGLFGGLGTAAGSVSQSTDGTWIYYEVELTPFTYLGIVSGGTNIVSTLDAGDVIGLDVDVVGHDGTAYTGVKCENQKTGKYENWKQFGLHKLAQIPGDANGDGAVDVGDLGILAANYGGSNKTWAEGDFNGDGAVDVGDLGILAANYGTGSSSGADFDADYAKVFGSTATEDATTDNASDNTLCSSLGLSLIAGLALMGLMIVKLEE